MWNFSRDEDKHKIVNKGCAAIRRGKLMGEILGIALVPELTGGMLGGAGPTMRSSEEWDSIGCKP